MSIFECKNLVKSYGSSVALNGIDLDLEAGRVVGLLGPNGSGKTTLIKISNGLLQPTGGMILIDGQPPGFESKSKIAYLPDRNFLPDYMKVDKLIRFYADFFEDFRTERAYEMLTELNVPLNSNLRKMSKGTVEKLQLILTMSRNADIYLLDEPIAGVDPATRDYIIKTIINNYSPDALVLISTHLIADVESILDDVVFLKAGEIVLHKSAEDIREKEEKSIDKLFREVFKC